MGAASCEISFPPFSQTKRNSRRDVLCGFPRVVARAVTDPADKVLESFLLLCGHETGQQGIEEGRAGGEVGLTVLRWSRNLLTSSTGHREWINQSPCIECAHFPHQRDAKEMAGLLPRRGEGRPTHTLGPRLRTTRRRAAGLASWSASSAPSCRRLPCAAEETRLSSRKVAVGHIAAVAPSPAQGETTLSKPSLVSVRPFHLKSSAG